MVSNEMVEQTGADEDLGLLVNAEQNMVKLSPLNEQLLCIRLSKYPD